jgi:hypothetical protein
MNIIRDTELSEIVQMVALVAPSWSVELHEASAAESSVVVMPEYPNDDIGPTFVVRKQGAEFCLDQFRFDTYATLGDFASLPELVAHLRSRLALLAAYARPVSELLH